MTPPGTVVPRRERARAATIEEIKSIALDLIREQGTTDVKFADIARAMEMTPPALYRYFADRDELFTALITDAYDDLGRAVGRARDAVPETDIAGRWLAAATAYREWARREPQRFSLIFGAPVPGYVAPDEGPTTEAARRAMSQLSELFVLASLCGELGNPLLRDVDASLLTCANEKHSELNGVLPPESFQAMLHAWSSLHGFTCLEAYGHLDWMGADARDALFATQVRLIARTSGLPVPH
ncbi:MAG: TetR/AcrR family transcriptional regulator [Actinomycetes bacterium]